ncbi:TfuA-like protein [Mycobacterium liflandii 128FXT]|uniref:TfuA-like protein n=1 Tax=Mycobacterium liflandii (strain 128FXT) TaxID=459424 RepID=L7V8H1_MYCL1|nr:MULTISPECIES: TfuA-like protein [Mycobacterium ulcerans group]AGC62850.1 TfuA-like protein [Mycobacterium liflandii 128FXT]RFZ64117.1 TfuA-like protein [Mycobacterium marinum]ULL10985.1 TfuA-like protein [Mycobacterium liflandii]
MTFTTTGGRIVVTAGPTISADDVHAVVPHAEVVPPIAFGHALGYGLRPGDALLIVDGLFFQQASVRHKELLTLISDGIRVVGSSSMGALRAAELHPFGMEGYGWVFEGYRDGLLEADDEVGMVHGDPEDGYPIFVDALVNIRQTLAHAVESGLLPAALADQLIDTARSTPFTQRTWNRLLDTVGAGESQNLAKQLRSLRVDIKHADAVLALQEVLRGQASTAVRPGPPPTVWSERWRQRWSPPTPVALDAAESAEPAIDAIDVADIDVLSLLSLCASDRWAYLPALEQVAAWHWSLNHPDASGNVGDRAALAAAEVPCDSYQLSLETVAHHYALATGIIDDAGFPEHVRAHWLTAEENSALGDDAVAVSARLTTRTLFFARSLPAVAHFLDLLRGDPRLPEWRLMAARAVARRDELARQKPHLNLRRPDPALLKQLFGTIWGTPVDRVELAQRGLMTEDAFYTAATVYAVAAADGQLPAIEVGCLGPVQSRQSPPAH